MRSHTVLATTALAAIILGLPPGTLAQNVSIGIVGGAGLTDDFRREVFPIFQGFPSTTNYSTPKRYIAGAMAELGLPWHFSLELDGLYRPLGYTFAGVEPDGTLNSVSPATVVTWEFPVLAKYRFAFRGVRPFVEAGPSFRTTGNLNSTNPSHYGVTAGLGVEMHLHGLNIAPAVRYTHWAADPAHSVQTIPNQLEFLVGFSRTSESNWRPLGPHVSLGVVAGTNLTGDFRTETNTYETNIFVPRPGGGYTIQQEIVTFTSSAGPKSFIVGPMVELELPKHFSVEAAAVYRPVHSLFQQTLSDGRKYSSGVGTNISWEFSVLTKYRFPALFEKSFQPFLELGPSFRLPQGLTGTSHCGVAAGAGVEVRVGPLKIAPAFRFTQWAPNNQPGFSNESRHQLEFMTGFSF
jgi:hypothetical protein